MENSTTKTVLISALTGGIVGILASIAVLATTEAPQQNPEDQQQLITDKDFISEEDLVVKAVEEASPAVVSIIITKDVPVLEEYYGESGPFDNFFGPNFRIPQYRDSGETEQKEIGGGSGFFVSEDGYIITNNHVVDQDDAEYTVFTNDGQKLSAEVVDKDTLNDIAILKVEGKGYPHLEFGNSEKLKAGQTVIAIGNPLLEFENSVSVGVVSGLSRNITAGTQVYGQSEYLEGVIQMDAAINPGNSGGPLLNLEGKVIGVNVAVASGENLAFSIPANTVDAAYQSVKQHGRIVRPFLGIRYTQIDEQLKEKNGLPVDYGVLVVRGETDEYLAVVPGSPADKAGLVENDIILEVEGEKLDGERSLAKMISSHKVGETIKLKVLHRGEEKNIEVTLEEPSD